jgi:hypothetical protein
VTAAVTISAAVPRLKLNIPTPSLRWPPGATA